MTFRKRLSRWHLTLLGRGFSPGKKRGGREAGWVRGSVPGMDYLCSVCLVLITVGLGWEVVRLFVSGVRLNGISAGCMGRWGRGEKGCIWEWGMGVMGGERCGK